MLAWLNQLESQFSQLLHTARYLVTRLQPYLFVLGMAQNHALRGAGKNNVAGLQRNVPGDIADDFRSVKNEIAGVRGLAGFAIDAAFDLQIVGIDLVGRNQIRPDRREVVGSLAEHPLASSIELQFPGAKVITGRIA